METRASYVVVGAFVFGLLASALGFVVWLGKLDLDRKANAYQIGFSGSVTGLSVGSLVRYRGIPVGEVTHIGFDPEDVERIVVLIDVDSTVPIKEDAHAILESQGLTGVGFIQIMGGSRMAKLLKPLPGRDVAEIPSRASMVEEVFESAPEIANQLVVLSNRAAAFLRPENRARMERILANLDAVSGALASEAEGIRTMIQNANEVTASLQDLTETMFPAVETLSDELIGLAEESGHTLSTIRGTISGLDGEMTTLSSDASRAMVGLEAVSQQAQSLISENRGAVNDFSQTGLYELTQFLVEGRLLLENLNRVVRQLERDPARILFGSRDKGVEVRK